MALTVTTTTVSANDADNLTINKPASVAVGDTLLIVANGFDSNKPTVSGFTECLTAGGASSYQAISMLYRIADASDVSASNYTIALTGATTQGAAAMFCIKGLTTVNPIFGSASATDVRDLASWTVTSSALTLSRPNEQLLIMAGVFNGESNSGSFGTYTVTSSDANPTWTELLDVQYSISSEPVEQAFFVAYAITTDTSQITQYSVGVSGATSGTADYVATIFAVIVEPQDQVGTNALLEVSPTIFNNAGVDVGGTGTNALLEVEPEFFAQSGSATSRTGWVNESKPTTSWNNEQL